MMNHLIFPIMLAGIIAGDQLEAPNCEADICTTEEVQVMQEEVEQGSRDIEKLLDAHDSRMEKIERERIELWNKMYPDNQVNEE